MKKVALFLCVGTWVFSLSCSEEEPTTPENQSPGTFTVTVSNITSESAVLDWTAPTDPDGDDISYDVILGSTIIVENRTARTTFLDNLSAETSYEGTVIARDGNEGESETAFRFDTEPVAPQNESPGSLSVTVSNVGHNAANLEWTAAEDPDGDAVTYLVMIGNEAYDAMNQTFIEPVLIGRSQHV